MRAAAAETRARECDFQERERGFGIREISA
jgi:hypothetical protein